MKTKHALKTILLDGVIVLIAISYVFFKTIVWEKQEIDPIKLLIEGVVGIIVGILIKQALGEKGFIKGYEDELYRAKKMDYEENCSMAVPFMEYSDKYYDELIDERKYKYRKTHLNGARLNYEKFFTESGENLEYEILPKWKIKKGYVARENERILDMHQRKVLNKCVGVKINILNLFSEYTKDTTNFSDNETTDNQQRARVFRKNLLVSIALVMAGIYYSPLLNEINWGSVIFASVQVLCFIATGLIQLYGNYQFIVVDKVQTYKEKTERISVFINKCKKGCYGNERMVEEKCD